MTDNKKGISRRVFINRSAAMTGGAVLLTHAGSWPAWAEVSAAEGVRSKMGRLAVDGQTGRVWLAKLKIDISTEDLDTEWGPTRVTQSIDSVEVSVKDGKKFDEPADVSGGQPDAKLAPEIAAAGGKVCVVWCGCHPETRQWRVYAAYYDGRSWSSPMEVAGGARPALTPRVAIDPDNGKAWVAYEDWADHSIKLRSYDGSSWNDHGSVCQTGQNYRPRLVVTKRAGKHKGKVAIVWDSYRDLQYDIYMRMVGPGGAMGEEMRVTKCARWDSMADVLEDLDGNIWVAWVRASNELSEFSAMRSVHTKFFDGEKWLFPRQPKKLYNPSEYVTANIAGMGSDTHEELHPVLRGEGREKGDGRVSFYSVAWAPTLQVDKRNRVYVFFMEGDPIIFAMWRHLDYRYYEGDKWSDPKRIKLGRGANIAKLMFGQSTVVAGDTIHAVWDQNDPREGPVMAHAEKVKIRDLMGPMTHPKGQDLPETMYDGWKVRDTFKPPRQTKINGETHTLIYGDTHVHSWSSDGADPSDYYYNFARDFAKLDFFALSDHDMLIANVPGLEAYISFLPKVFSEPDFVCFQAYEFTSQTRGHRCVVFEGDDRPIINMFAFLYPKEKRTNTNGMLYSFMHKFGLSPDSRVMVTAHNMFNLGNDFSEYDESMEPLYDVMSQHVAAEKTLDEYVADGVLDGGATRGITSFMTVMQRMAGDDITRDYDHKWFHCWREALGNALPLGAYGGSDTHAVSGLGWITAGLWVREKTRKSIFDSMFERKSIAIDNQARNEDVFNLFPFLESRIKDLPVRRMDVRFWVDDHFMGSRPSINSVPVAKAYAQSQDKYDPVSRIVFVKDGREMFAERNLTPSGDGFEARWKDDSWSTGRHYYYVRIEFESGDQGYSSPVFVNY